MEDYGEHTTGTRDEHYNLISVLYHALSAADTCERYALDAETVGDERLAAFFREAQVMQSQIAERAKGLLGILEHPPEFGTSPATGSTPASGSTPDMPRTRCGTRRGCGTGNRIRCSDRSSGGGRAALRRFPAGRGVAIEGGATTWRGRAREAGGHNTADPAGRTVTR